MTISMQCMLFTKDLFHYNISLFKRKKENGVNLKHYVRNLKKHPLALIQSNPFRMFTLFLQCIDTS